MYQKCVIFLIRRPINTCEQYCINIKPTKVYVQFECRSPKRWAKFVQLRKTFTGKTAHILLPSDLIHIRIIIIKGAGHDRERKQIEGTHKNTRVINLIIRVLIWGT